jgi:hypothetical protein
MEILIDNHIKNLNVIYESIDIYKACIIHKLDNISLSYLIKQLEYQLYPINHKLDIHNVNSLNSVEIAKDSIMIILGHELLNNIVNLKKTNTIVIV